MLNKKVKWLDNFITRHTALASVVFSISAILASALCVLIFEFKFFPIAVSAFAFSAALILFYVKSDLQRGFASAITYKRLFFCAIASILICFYMTKEVYLKWFYDVTHGGGMPVIIKNIYDIMPIPDAPLNVLIISALIFCGAAAVYAVTVILSLLPDFIKSTSNSLPARILPRPGGRKLSYRIIGGVLLGAMAVMMILYSQTQSFWVDELDWTIGKIANKSFAEITKQLLEDGYNMPLYYYVLSILYPLAPYGEGYLLSLSIAAILLGIIFLYFAARQIGGERLGFIALCIASVSGTLMTQGAWELRPYAFYFCFSALTLLFYAKRLAKETWGNIVGYGIAMILLLYTHWFGAIMLVFYGLGDLFLCIRKKVHIRCIISYAMAIAAVIPWFISILIFVKYDPGEYWVDIPSSASLLATFYYLLSNHKLTLFMAAFSSVILFAALFLKLRERRWNQTLFFLAQTLFCCAWVVGVVFVYSRYINPGGSIYYDRYFFALVPHAVLLAALGAGFVIDYIVKNSSMRFSHGIAIFLAIIAAIGYSSYTISANSVMRIKEPFRELSDYFLQSDDTYSDDTLIVISTGGEAWVEYYFLKRGFDAPLNIANGINEPHTKPISDPIPLIFSGGRPAASGRTIAFADILKYDTVYYLNVRGGWGAFHAELLEFLSENYTLTSEISELRLSRYGR
ncbi:MAG: glycosyltransferase family 39 protein [Oscillospiraceae bacterium]|nr:glycosyltransferase family 39 protein [Oscillospiraceae bacterium]